MKGAGFFDLHRNIRGWSKQGKLQEQLAGYYAHGDEKQHYEQRNGKRMNTFIMAFAGHSGAGKSTLIKKLCSMTGSSNVLRVDDYDSSSYPRASKWIEDGADPNEFQTPEFFSDILALRNGQAILHSSTNQEVQPARFLFIEEPFGRGRHAISSLIDFSIYIDTPLEIALARKLLRMSTMISQGISDITIEGHLEWYLRAGRNFYLAVERSARKNCDLIVDGMLSPAEMAKIICQAIITKLPTWQGPDHSQSREDYDSNEYPNISTSEP